MQVTKEIKMDKSDGNKMKKISFKGTIKKVKKQLTEWEKTLANHIFEKRLVSRTHNANLVHKGL